MRKINLNIEREFENQKVKDRDSKKAQDKFYWATNIQIIRHNLNTFKKIKDKRILEIGCSYGRDALLYTKYAAFYCGIDLSDEAIKKAINLKLENSEFLCVDGHDIPKEDESFDFVVVNGLLHHLDLERSFQEINRVLKSGGYLIFREPLGTNPFFQLYRYLTPLARTPDERPFTLSDIKLMKDYFYLKNVEWFGFLSIFSAYLQINLIRKILTSLDYYLSKTPIKIFFWQFCGFAMKKNLK